MMQKQQLPQEHVAFLQQGSSDTCFTNENTV